MDDLSTASGVPKRTLLRFERAEGLPRKATLIALQTAFTAAGIEFIAENGGGAGVRLRKQQA